MRREKGRSEEGKEKKEEVNKEGEGKGKEGKKLSKGKVKDKAKGWLPYVIGALVVIYALYNGTSLPSVWDRSPEENMNIFLNDTENLSKEEGTGDRLYDENQITVDQIGRMGQEEYLVYVHTGMNELDSKIHESLRVKTEMEDVKWYGIDALEVKEYDERYYREAPLVLVMERMGQVALVKNELRTAEDVRTYEGGSEGE